MGDPSDASIDTANQLHRSALRLLRLLRDTRPAKGLGLSKLSVLSYLYRGGVSTATAMASYLRVKPQSLTRLVADMERRSLITRRPNEADRRQCLLEITDTGIQLLTEEVRDQRMELAQAIAKELTPTEQEMLRLASGLLDRLTAGAEEQTLTCRRTKRRRDAAEMLG